MKAAARSDDFAQIAAILSRHSGIVFGPESKSVLERRIQKRVGALGLESMGGYAKYLSSLPSSHPEIQNAIEQVTIKETYFLRESLQIDAWIEELSKGRDPMRPRAELPKLSVWSAGCATGEEAYTIAMMLAESHAIDPRNVRILGTDISRRSIEAARKAVYGPSSFRAIPSDLKNRYFIKQDDGDLVRDILRQNVKFACANILERDKAAMVAQFDAIFCRNVLIYFGDAARQRALDLFFENLAPGGFLCLGHSESLLRTSTPFEAVSTRAGILYRKPALPTRRTGSDGIEPGAELPRGRR
jgi:chemotaxis protein methyltransferase CheR